MDPMSRKVGPGIAIVGVARDRLRAEDPEPARGTPKLQEITTFRGALVPNDASIDNRTVWRTTQAELQPLIDRLDREVAVA